MSASRYWLMAYGVLLAGTGCTSESSSAPLTPSETDSSLTSTELPEPPQPQGGQSGTDADGSYSCDGEGAAPLARVPLYEVPEGYSCSPDLVLRSLAGTYTLRCDVTGPAAVPSPTLTVEVFAEGAVATLLDAVSLDEDGSTGPCTLLGIGANVNVYSPEINLRETPQQIIVDRFCAYPTIIVNGRATFAGEEVDVKSYFSFDGLTRRINSAIFTSDQYHMNCSEVPPSCQ
ncbi:MAG TPA: hypothetical protein VJU61_25355 [Polyangiaceae bacterium]|nr:hypothetical protein [Polyangiaceae bacterium]